MCPTRDARVSENSRKARRAKDAGDASGAIAEYLQRHEAKRLLRFITCGSVDDGKSTLIGRLLYDARALLDDQAAALFADGNRATANGDGIDFASLVDGLSAEREQGITIDVAYRYFDTDRRKFIVADCPGHEQYTRNMATGASTADLAIVLVDARKGLLTQTRRHSYILALLGIRHVVLAVNKMDLVDYRQDIFEAITSDYRQLAAQLGIDQVTGIPLSALDGDNVLEPSPHMPWYRGPMLLDHLETVVIESPDTAEGFRLPVQWVCRSNQDFRGFAGTLLAGSVAVGDAITVSPSGGASTVARIFSGDSEVTRAGSGQPVVLGLTDEIDIGRGDIICAANAPLAVADQFAANLLWMDQQPLLPGRPYWLKIGARTVGATITELKYQIDVNTQTHLAAKTLECNQVGYCNLYLNEPIGFQAFSDNRNLGGFILIDRQSNATVGAGTLDFALRRASNIRWQHVDVDKASRALIKHQRPRCLWFTGLSGAGKSTIANLVEKQLLAMGRHTYLLDGDNIRHGLNNDLGFTDEDRVENIRRVAEVARLMVDAGLVVLVSFISPFRAERKMARRMFAEGEFLEVFVDTSLSVAEQRDAKGLYAKARAGQLRNFTGIDSPYEVPEAPDMVLETCRHDAETLAAMLVRALDD
ncbi:sulfate adenylyltransferase subunit CysN [Lysobacter sp. A03]|uniref:sulfate adenylyltransferase subunit CysN n=1 Tax=Lysobacter sp. A03 TaxID=1199154 RepID=UPI0005B732D8|nr:sulfate adenylyltransferase subunit CysN [Lysobacter sp. A03]KIQ97640.1 Sulfate adenylyltransferase subunit 1 [Lysobacter sp. A03]